MANIYSVIVYTSGLLGLVLQLVGLVSWAWLQINMDTRVFNPQGMTSVNVTIKASLWRIEMCAHSRGVQPPNLPVEKCESVSKSDLLKQISETESSPAMTGPTESKTADQNQQEAAAAANTLLGDFDVLPYLTSVAFMTSILGFAVFMFQHSSCCAKAKSRVEIVSLLLWLISVILLASAVGIGGHLNSFLANIYSLVSNMNLPEQNGTKVSIKASVNFPWSILLTGMGMVMCFVNVVAITIDICVTKFKRSTDYWKYGQVRLVEDHQSVELLNNDFE